MSSARLLWLLLSIAVCSRTAQSTDTGGKWLFPGISAQVTSSRVVVTVDPSLHHYDAEDLKLDCLDLQSGQTPLKFDFGSFQDGRPARVLQFTSAPNCLYMCIVTLRDTEQISTSLVEQTLLLTPRDSVSPAVNLTSSGQLVRLIVSSAEQAKINVSLVTGRNFTGDLKLRAHLRVWLSGSLHIHQYQLDMKPTPSDRRQQATRYSASVLLPENLSIHVHNWFRKEPHRSALEICHSLEVERTDRLAEVCRLVQPAELGIFTHRH